MPPRRTRKKNIRRRAQRKRVYIGGQGQDRQIFVSMLTGEGLGNQLFILAAALVAQKKTGLPISVLPSTTNPHTKMDYRTLFKTPKISVVEEANGRARMNAANSILEIQDFNATAKWSNANIKYNSGSAKNVKIPARLYQNYSAIHTVIPAVKDILTANEFSKKPIYKEIQDATPSGSAFIHVRRGDYKDQGAGWILGEDYFMRGLDELEKDAKVKTICIISKDMDWCKGLSWASHTKKPIKYYDSENELEVLYKMSTCTAGAVISSSTFSAWGAMLGADMNPSATIVYPISWLTHDADGDNPLVFPDRWKGIPNTDGTSTLTL